KTGKAEKFIDGPNHKAIGDTKIDSPKIKSANLASMEYDGQRYITRTEEEAPDFALLHAQLSVAVFRGVSLNLSVRNLLDKDYYLALGYPREGRSFLTTLSYRF